MSVPPLLHKSRRVTVFERQNESGFVPRPYARIRVPARENVYVSSPILIETGLVFVQDAAVYFCPWAGRSILLGNSSLQRHLHLTLSENSDVCVA